MASAAIVNSVMNLAPPTSLASKHTLPRVVTAGEALIDLVSQADGHFQPCLGGAVFNLTRALGRQNVPTLYQNPLSSDRFGRQLAQALQRDGVQLAMPQPVAQPTSLAVVTLNAAGHPDYAFYREGVADRQINAASMNAVCAAQPQLEIVCTGCLALDPADAPHYLTWWQAQKAAGRWLVVDVNLRPSVMPDLAQYRAHVLAMAQLADVLKASDEDLAHLQLPGNSPMEQAMHLMNLGAAQWMALTLGAEGAHLLVRNGAQIKVFSAREAAPLKVLDTVGAGDSFLAGLLACALHHADQHTPAHILEPGQAPKVKTWASQATDRCLQDVLAHALASASLVVMRRGCDPAHWDEVRARMTAFPAN
jgi:fructokinase